MKTSKTPWSDEAYDDRASYRASTGKSAFEHDEDIRSGAKEAKVHEKLNPFGVKVRESRDSAASPESNPIVIVLDGTGSMDKVIAAIQKSLKALMGLLTRKGYIKCPQIMIIVIGDVPNGEIAPLQVGQFEIGIEIDDDLSRIFIEGKGGATMQESYQNAAYFIARHTATDAWEKRGKRGYVFFIGDETNYARVSAHEVKTLIGDNLQDNIPTEDIYAELAERWQPFFILPKGAMHGGDKTVVRHWQGLVGAQHVLELADPDATAQLIATQIGLCEENTDLDRVASDLKDVGASNAMVQVVTGSVSTAYRGGAAVTKVPPGTLSRSDEPSQVQRL